MNIGTKIKTIRELKNLSIKEIANKLDMSISGYSRIERNEVDPNTEKLQKIASALEVSPNELFNFDDKNVFHNCTATNQSTLTAQNFNNHFPIEMKQLYESNIKLLEEKVKMLEDQILNFQKIS